MLNNLAVLFNIAQPDYNPDRISQHLRSLARDGQVWNYMPGVYLFKSEMDSITARKSIKAENFDGYIVLNFDPAESDGDLPELAWDSYLLNVYRDDADRLFSRYNLSHDEIKQINQMIAERSDKSNA